MFSRKLIYEIKEALRKREQIILFLNRRAFLPLFHVEAADMFLNVLTVKYP